MKSIFVVVAKYTSHRNSPIIIATTQNRKDANAIRDARNKVLPPNSWPIKRFCTIEYVQRKRG